TPLAAALLFGAHGGQVPGETLLGTPGDWALTIGLATAGALAGPRLRMPAGTLLTPLLVTGALTVAGFEFTVPALLREIGFALIARRLREIGRPVDWSYEILFAALIGGLVGARGYYLLQNHSQLSLGDVFGGSGLIWYGGLLGGTVTVLVWARRRDFLSLQLLDLAAPGLALGYAIGRIGCQVSGDGDYGKPSDLPWAMGYPKGTVPTDPGVTVHPTPIYETVVMGLVAWLLWRWRDRFRPGVLFAFYLVFAGIERFLVEFV